MTYEKASQREKYLDPAEVVIFSAIYGNYDQVTEQPELDCYRCVLFTDNKEVRAETWEVRYHPLGYDSSRLNAKYIKLFPYRLFPEFRYSFWLDANYEIYDWALPLRFAPFLQNGMVALDAWGGSGKDCAYKESEAALKRSRVDPERLKAQLEFYRSEGFPEHFGLFGNAMLLRDHQSPELKKIMEAWWDQNIRFTSRDQISLPYVLWKLGLMVGKIPLESWLHDCQWGDHNRYDVG